MAKVDIKAIAKACSVSTATVSRVFNDKEGVSDAVRKQVIQIARSMNYAPKQAAAQHDIAIIIDKNDDLLKGGYSFRSLILTRLLYEFFRHDLSIKLVDVKQADLLLPGYAKAALPMLREEKSQAVVDQLHSVNIPVVFVNRIAEKAYSVCSDHYGGTALAMEYLIKLGHKKVGLLLDNPDNWAGKERIRAYHDILAKYGLEPLKVETIHHEQKTIVECLAALHAQRITGFFIGGESIVDETVYMLNLLKISVPDDLSVISCEKNRASQWLNPPHTTVSQSFDDICEEVVTLVKDLLAGKDVSTQPRFLTSRLIERSSVRAID